MADSKVPVLLPRLAVAAAAGAVAIALSPFALAVTLLVVNLVLLGAAAGDWLAAARPGRLGVERDLPGVIGLDQEASIIWRVRNPTDRALRVRLSDELVPSLRAATRRPQLLVPPAGSAEARTTIRPGRRGRFDPTELVIRVEGPLRLVARQGRRALPGTVRVYPPFRSRDAAELRIRRARILEVGLRSAQGRGGGTEFDSLREYSVDDEFRRIDWAATARTGRAIVRTYRAERNQTMLVLLDTGRTMAGRIALPGAGDDPLERAAVEQLQNRSLRRAPDKLERTGLPRLDHAMDAVMALTVVSTRLGDRAGLVAFADEVRAVVRPGHGRDQLAQVTEALVTLEPRLVESDYRGAFAGTLTRFRRRALLVVLTELAAQAIPETLLPALPLIVRDHVVVIGAVRDPALDALATAVPDDAGGVYRKAASVAALDDRRRTVARLRAAGAVVVDASPADLAGRLSDAYLEVKAAGRL